MAIFACEAFRLNMSLFSVTLQCVSPGEHPETLVLAMPHPVAKQLCLILRKTIKAVEDKRGIIELPPESYQAMGISPEDWENWLGSNKI